MTELITAKTLRKAFSDSKKMAEPKAPQPTDGSVEADGKAKKKAKAKRPVRYDVSDSRVAGLQLRVKPTGVRWSMRARLHGDQHRYDLGPAVEGSEDVGGLCVDGARSRAARVAEMVRNGHNPATYLAAVATGVSIETQRKIAAEKPVPSWTWEAAKTAFLADVKRTRRADTHRDYRGKLQPVELDRFSGRRVNTITRNEMGKVVEAVHERGAETMAAGMVRVIKRMWTWLAESARQDDTNVADGVMAKLAPPEKTRVEIGEPVKKGDEEDDTGDAPPPIEIGRALVIARQGYLAERIGLGIQLLIGTVQRRRTVTGAHDGRFRAIKESNSEHAWLVPPYFRKSGTKRGNRAHLVPVVGFAAEAPTRLEELVKIEGGDGWLFPVGRTARADRPHAAADLLNDYLDVMPGVGWTPHAVRYAFATYGEGKLGFAKGEGRLILDHMEGTEPNDVTGQFYSSDPGVARKREMMKRWTDWCDEWAEKAVAADPLLLDRAFMMRTMYIARYGEERFERRKAYRSKRGLALWGDGAPEDEDLRQAAE